MRAWRRWALVVLVLGGVGIPGSSAAANPVPICTGVAALLDGSVDVSWAVQSCIDATPDGGVLELPAGIYRLDRQLRVRRPLTLRSAGAGAAGPLETCPLREPLACAAFVASDALLAAGGLLSVEGTRAVVVDRVILWGNRDARLGSAAARECHAGDRRTGYNARFVDCADCAFTRSVNAEALCGTGLEWRGATPRARIEASLFRGNGNHEPTHTDVLWADGLTVHQSDGGLVASNRFEDNTDIDLIVGGGRDLRVVDNVIVHREATAFGALMLHQFTEVASSGDFTGAVVSGNDIDCGPELCHFGIQLGGHPWHPSLVFGGEVTGNRVRGARQMVNVEGAGTPADPIALHSNDIASPARRWNRFLCGLRLTSALNINDRDSIVDRRGETEPVATRRRWHDCP